jgi:hypothetical protein
MATVSVLPGSCVPLLTPQQMILKVQLDTVLEDWRNVFSKVELL